MGYYSSGWSLVVIGLFEAIVFPWVYGAKRLAKDIEFMIGFKLGPQWWICWTFISPILLIVSYFIEKYHIYTCQHQQGYQYYICWYHSKRHAIVTFFISSLPN